MSADSPDEYLRENQDTFVRIIKHGTDEFVRAFALAALVDYGEDPDIEHVRHELERTIERGGDR